MPTDVGAVIEDKNAVNTKDVTESMFNVLIVYCKEII